MQRATAGSVSQENQVTEDLIGENRLWTAVIVNAVQDWRYGTLRARREAQTFLFDDHADFENVCSRAGLDAESFRGKLLKIGRRIEMEGALTLGQTAFFPAGASRHADRNHRCSARIHTFIILIEQRSLVSPLSRFGRFAAYRRTFRVSRLDIVEFLRARVQPHID